jgi:hypothetical protein
MTRPEQIPAIRISTAADKFRMYLVWTYIGGSVAATVMTLLLVALGLEFTSQQWGHFLLVVTLSAPNFRGTARRHAAR